MKNLYHQLIAGVLSVSFFLSGCESILLEADLDQATVEAAAVATRTTEWVPEESVAEVEQSMDKYGIGGKDAFYILPAHRPAPDNLVDFQVLDLVDGVSVIYAYQAMYRSSDPSGLGGAPEQGYAADTDNAAGSAITNTEDMATILMAYHTDTRKYQVFLHQVSPLDKTVVKAVDETSGETEGVDASTGGQETGGLFAHKLTGQGNRYFIYLNGVGSVYDENGQIIYQKDISSLLDYNISRYGGEGASVTISNVIMDKNYFMYVTMNIEKAGSSIDENTEESDLEDEGSDVTQILSYCFEYNIGEPENPSEEEKSYFISKNVNYEKQISAWEEADQEEYDLGVLDGEPSEEEIRQAVPGIWQILEEVPNEYAVFQYCDDAFGWNLQFYISLNWFWKWGAFQQIGQNGQMVTIYGYAAMHEANAPAVSALEIYPKNWVHYAVSMQNSFEKKQYCLIDYDQQPEAQTENVTQKERTYRVVWQEEEEGEEEGQESSYSEHSIEIKETAYFSQSYELRFRGDAAVTWSEDIYSTDMIAQSPGSGVVRYGREGEETDEKQTSFLQWMLESADDFNISGVEGEAQNVLFGRNVSQGEESSFLIVQTSQGLTVYPAWKGASAAQAGKLFIPNSKINFGVSIDSGGIDELNQVSLKRDDEGTDAGDEPLPSAAMAGSDSYNRNAILVKSENGSDYLYLAGLDNGLIQYNLSAGADSPGQAGQISSCPYYGIWEDEDDPRYLYGIGYQSTDYAYSEDDLCCAKLYRIALKDEEASSNLTVSVLNMDENLKRKIARGGAEAEQAWEEMLSNLGLKQGNLRRVNQYREFLLESSRKKEAAILRVYELANIPAAQRTNELEAEITACRYPLELEFLIVGWKTDSEANRQKTLDQLTKNAGLTSEEWNSEMNRIVFRLQIPDSFEGFVRQKAVEIFVQMAGINLQTGLEARIRSCESAEELERLMAEFRLDSITLYRLAKAAQGGALADVTPEQILEAEEKREEAIRLCKQDYLETGYEEQNDTKKYWKDVFGTSWNQQWDNLWENQLEEILNTFHQSEE